MTHSKFRFSESYPLSMLGRGTLKKNKKEKKNFTTKSKMKETYLQTSICVVADCTFQQPIHLKSMMYLAIFFQLSKPSRVDS